MARSDVPYKGFKKCTGDIVAWIYSEPQHVEGAISCAVAYFSEHTGIDMVHGKIDLIDVHGEIYNVCSV